MNTAKPAIILWACKCDHDMYLYVIDDGLHVSQQPCLRL